jgi:hypothetical protein
MLEQLVEPQQKRLMRSLLCWDYLEQLHIVPQNLIEFWNVYTRPAQKNGMGHTVAEAEVEINRLKAFFPLLLDTEAIYQEWERLVVVHAVMGVNVHDARLVAAMLVHELTHILTFNIARMQPVTLKLPLFIQQL